MDQPTIPKRPVGRPRKNPKPETTIETVTTEITAPKPKQKRNRPDLAKFGQENVQPGDNSRYLGHVLRVGGMPMVDLNDPEAVRERIATYFEICHEDDMKPTVMGLCNSLHISRQALLSWKNGTHREDSHQAIILQAYGYMEELWEHYMQNGKINPVSGIFLGKNNYNYHDKQEHILTPNTTTIESADAATIAAKYDELPEG